MKGVDDFYWVLLVALALIVIFTIVSALWPYSPVPGGVGPGGGAVVTVAEFALGTVGYSENAARSSSLGSFTVGETQSEELRKVPQLEISAGWFGANSEKINVEAPSYLLENMRDVVIGFSVYDTNQYANLHVKWNGKEFYSEKPSRGHVEVRIDANYVESSNTLDVYCDGPGLAFWAATVYTLRDFGVELEYGPSKLVAFTLGQSDLETLSKAELSFIGFGTSPLRVKVNGYKIWEKVPNGVETVGFNFTGAPLKQGTNILSLDCPAGQASLNNAKLDIYLLTNQVTRTRSFEMTDSQYGLMKSQGYSGTVKFRVDSVSRPGELGIELNSNALHPGQPAEGWNSVSFSSGEGQTGTNTLEFSGTGYWDIGQVQVVLGK